MARRKRKRSGGLRMHAYAVARDVCHAAGVDRSGHAPRAIGTDHELTDENGDVVIGWVESVTMRQIGPDLWFYDLAYRPNLEFSHPLWCVVVHRGAVAAMEPEREEPVVKASRNGEKVVEPSFETVSVSTDEDYRAVDG